MTRLHEWCEKHGLLLWIIASHGNWIVAFPTGLTRKIHSDGSNSDATMSLHHLEVPGRHQSSSIGSTRLASAKGEHVSNLVLRKLCMTSLWVLCNPYDPELVENSDIHPPQVVYPITCDPIILHNHAGHALKVVT